MVGRTQARTGGSGVQSQQEARPDFPHYDGCDGVIVTTIHEDTKRNGVVKFRRCRDCGQIAELHIMTNGTEFRRVNDDRLQYYENALVDLKDSTGLPHVTGKIARRADYHVEEGEYDQARELLIGKLHLEAKWHHSQHPDGDGFFSRHSPESTAEKIRDLP